MACRSETWRSVLGGGGGMELEKVMNDGILLAAARFSGGGGSSRASGATSALDDGDLGKGMPDRSRREKGLMGLARAAKELKRRTLASRASLDDM